jgi:hypothetical protein
MKSLSAVFCLSRAQAHLNFSSKISADFSTRVYVYEKGKDGKVCGEFLIKKSYKVKQQYWHAETYAAKLFTCSRGEEKSRKKVWEKHYE